MLESDETVLLDAHASLKLGLLRQQGFGRVFLTNRRIVWLHGAPRLLLRAFFWLHSIVQIPLESTLSVQRFGDGLRLRSSDENYSLLIARRYWSLFNPFAASDCGETAEEWRRSIAAVVAAP